MPSSRPSASLPHPRLRAFALRWLNPLVVRLGIAGARGSPIGIVRHVGSRSGLPYATPFAVHRRGRWLFVPLTYGPAAPACRNVLTAEGCVVRLGGRELRAVEPRIVAVVDLPPGLRRVYRRIPMIRTHLRLRIEGLAAVDDAATLPCDDGEVNGTGGGDR